MDKKTKKLISKIFHHGLESFYHFNKLYLSTEEREKYVEGLVEAREAFVEAEGK